MANLVGSKGFSGNVVYEGIEEAMKYDNVKIHIYGKKKTKPNRKMGHVTIICDKFEDAYEKAKYLKKTIKVKSRKND